jgi:hypothetical protein
MGAPKGNCNACKGINKYRMKTYRHDWGGGGTTIITRSVKNSVSSGARKYLKLKKSKARYDPSKRKTRYDIMKLRQL